MMLSTTLVRTRLDMERTWLVWRRVLAATESTVIEREGDFVVLIRVMRYLALALYNHRWSVLDTDIFTPLILYH
jgi:LEA14-like dessication related protein